MVEDELSKHIFTKHNDAINVNTALINAIVHIKTIARGAVRSVEKGCCFVRQIFAVTLANSFVFIEGGAVKDRAIFVECHVTVLIINIIWSKTKTRIVRHPINARVIKK